jgi:hypothetical protein
MPLIFRRTTDDDDDDGGTDDGTGDGTDGQRTDDDDGTDEGTDGQRTTTTGHDDDGKMSKIHVKYVPIYRYIYRIPIRYSK